MNVLTWPAEMEWHRVLDLVGINLNKIQRFSLLTPQWFESMPSMAICDRSKDNDKIGTERHRKHSAHGKYPGHHSVSCTLNNGVNPEVKTLWVLKFKFLHLNKMVLQLYYQKAELFIHYFKVLKSLQVLGTVLDINDTKGIKQDSSPWISHNLREPSMQCIHLPPQKKVQGEKKSPQGTIYNILFFFF